MNQVRGLYELVMAALAVCWGYGIHFIVIWALAEHYHGRLLTKAEEYGFVLTYVVAGAALALGSLAFATWMARSAKASTRTTLALAIIFGVAGFVPYLEFVLRVVLPKLHTGD